MVVTGIPGTFGIGRRSKNEQSSERVLLAAAAWRAVLNSVGVIERRSMANAGSSEFQVLECKQCHGFISSTETIAYHLVDQILYGWCGDCFARRAEVEPAAVGHALRVEAGSRAA